MRAKKTSGRRGSRSELMTTGRAIWLIAALLPASSGGAAFLEDFNLGESIKGIPGAVKRSLGTFRSGTGQMWSNGKIAGTIKKRVRREGYLANYGDIQLMRNSREDTSKLLQAGFLWLAAPELLAVQD